MSGARPRHVGGRKEEEEEERVVGWFYSPGGREGEGTLGLTGAPGKIAEILCTSSSTSRKCGGEKRRAAVLDGCEEDEGVAVEEQEEEEEEVGAEACWRRVLRTSLAQVPSGRSGSPGLEVTKGSTSTPGRWAARRDTPGCEGASEAPAAARP